MSSVNETKALKPKPTKRPAAAAAPDSDDEGKEKGPKQKKPKQKAASKKKPQAPQKREWYAIFRAEFEDRPGRFRGPVISLVGIYRTQADYQRASYSTLLNETEFLSDDPSDDEGDGGASRMEEMRTNKYIWGEYGTWLQDGIAKPEDLEHITHKTVFVGREFKSEDADVKALVVWVSTDDDGNGTTEAGQHPTYTLDITVGGAYSDLTKAKKQVVEMAIANEGESVELKYVKDAEDKKHFTEDNDGVVALYPRTEYETVKRLMDTYPHVFQIPCQILTAPDVPTRQWHIAKAQSEDPSFPCAVPKDAYDGSKELREYFKSPEWDFATEQAYESVKVELSGDHLKGEPIHAGSVLMSDTGQPIGVASGTTLFYMS